MLKYRGTYRVIYEIDNHTGKPTELTFIPCRIRKGANIYRYDKDTLAVFIPGIKTANRLLREHPDIFRPLQIGDSEGTLLLKETDIEQAADILLPRVLGKNMNPRPKRICNLSEEERRIIGERLRAARYNSTKEKKATS